MLLETAKTDGQENQECIIKYNLFKGDYLSKKYNESFDNWMYLMDNCKDLSVNIYKYGSYYNFWCINLFICNCS